MSPVRTSRSLTASLDEATIEPSGEKATLQTERVSLRRQLNFRVAKSHRLTWPSILAVARNFPSREKDTNSTQSEYSLSSWDRCAPSKSHSLTMQSPPLE